VDLLSRAPADLPTNARELLLNQLRIVRLENAAVRDLVEHGYERGEARSLIRRELMRRRFPERYLPDHGRAAHEDARQAVTRALYMLKPKPTPAVEPLWRG
jgi:hypothetical protein